ncbi:MAG: hypothetical protein HY015_03995 [Bacteroidetes bacterium]|nr:hypothetical protein [Bacteroidota bacterium]MBI3482124.1 hypothetical protein [Bacteroidota bacterium]
MNSMQNLEDIKVGVKLKLSALWAAVMFCYIYGDYFSLYVPGHIQSLMDGNSGMGATTPLKLLMFAILMTLPSVMVFLSLLLKPKVNRWINILMGIFFTAIMILVVATSIDQWMIFFIFLGVVEILITSLVVWYAWTWPKQ